MSVHEARLVPLADLSPHPRNYRTHPAEQITHLAASIEEHGFYRNVVAARDLTILAGHGVVEAAATIPVDAVPVIVLDLDPLEAAALKILAGDNEIARLAGVDHAGLAAILSELDTRDPLAGLLGTGYDTDGLAERLRVAQALAAGPTDALEAWRGMPAFSQGDKNSAYRCTVHFRSGADADAFFKLIKRPKASSLWWPDGDGHVGSDLSKRYVSPDDAS